MNNYLLVYRMILEGFFSFMCVVSTMSSILIELLIGGAAGGIGSLAMTLVTFMKFVCVILKICLFRSINSHVFKVSISIFLTLPSLNH